MFKNKQPVWIFDDEELYDHIPELDSFGEEDEEAVNRRFLENAQCLNCPIDSSCCGIVCGVCEYTVCECHCKGQAPYHPQ